MRCYTLLLLRDGKTVRQVKYSLGDDLDALDRALRLCRHNMVEVYDDTRFVARVKEGDAPLTIEDARSG